MAMNLDAIRHLRLSCRQTIAPRDAILYALGIGLGADPTDERQLRFVYEDGILALPTQAITFTYPALLAAYGDAGITMHRVLHGEQQFVLERPLPTSAELEGETRMIGLVDKGPGRGLLIYYRTEIRNLAGNELVATLTSSSFCVDEGGACGTAAAPAQPPIARHVLPDRAPDEVCELATLPQAALIYRLSGDYNPMHALPSVARAAGHARPILHGRCTFGVAGHAVLRSVCDYEPARIRSMTARFTTPVFPGETLRTELWHAPGGVLFRTRIKERDRVALDNGFAALGDAP
ncbi:MAG TPA: MaoC/PaaZ C-terminal domain-containing protein [Burkholderiaceae bacterium]|jgi:acyl dehydratase